MGNSLRKAKRYCETISKAVLQTAVTCMKIEHLNANLIIGGDNENCHSKEEGQESSTIVASSIWRISIMVVMTAWC